MDKEKQALSLAIMKALAYAENGGKPDLANTKAGPTGEAKSIFQFTPDTWKLYSKQVFGENNIPLDNQHESIVVHTKILNWLNDGYNTEQIASMWNAGEQRPDAYKENWKGTNKQYGIAYDTPAYAKKVADYTNKFKQEAETTIGQPSSGIANTTPSVSQTTGSTILPQNTQGVIPQGSGLLSRRQPM